MELFFFQVFIIVNYRKILNIIFTFPSAGEGIYPRIPPSMYVRVSEFARFIIYT